MFKQLFSDYGLSRLCFWVGGNWTTAEAAAVVAAAVAAAAEAAAEAAAADEAADDTASDDLNDYTKSDEAADEAADDTASDNLNDGTESDEDGEPFQITRKRNLPEDPFESRGEREVHPRIMPEYSDNVNDDKPESARDMK
jgi:nucleosome binding factor SPN SPT16 subunit